MVLEDINYWESEKNYENNIFSVFAVNNTLTDYILKTKNKNRKEIADFGCGIGNAIPYLKNFKKIYEIDFSSNMLKQAKEKFKNLSNIDFIEGDLKNAKIKPVDIILSLSSLMPKNYSDFENLR